MAVIADIQHEDGYLHVSFQGKALRIRDGFERAIESHQKQIVEATARHECRLVLLDLTQVSGSIGVTEEHLAATCTIKYWPPGMRLALVPSPTFFADPGRHLERVARNRGAAVQVFADVPAAQAWLTANRPTALSA